MTDNQQQQIAGVNPLANWIQEAGKLKKTGVILAGLKQVTVNIIDLRILRQIDPIKVSSGVWNLEQLQRSIEIGIGVASAKLQKVSHRRQSLPEND